MRQCFGVSSTFPYREAHEHSTLPRCSDPLVLSESLISLDSETDELSFSLVYEDDSVESVSSCYVKPYSSEFNLPSDSESEELSLSLVFENDSRESVSSSFTNPFLSGFQIPSDSTNEDLSLSPVYENTSRKSLSVLSLQSDDETFLLDLDKRVVRVLSSYLV